MKVCFFGSYAPDPMNSLLKKKLEMQGIETVECNEEITNVFSFFRAYFKLPFKNRKIKYDIMIIPLWRALITLPLAKIISRKPILYFGYMPIYDTIVNDRKIAKPNSVLAKFIFFVEKTAWRWSDMILKESNAEIDYFSNQFNVDKKKFRRLLISSDESKFPSCQFKEFHEKFVVLYHGTFIPHHGVDTIIKAARILSEENKIIFKLCGKGQTLAENKELAEKNKLKNVEFLGWLEFDKLIENINHSDVCLGIFGDSSKATYGVTNKNYQILCSQKPLITRDSPAMQEINAENRKNCILVPPNDPKKLAEAILFLKDNSEERKKIAMNGRKLYVDKLSMSETSKQLVQYLQELLSETKVHT